MRARLLFVLLVTCVSLPAGMTALSANTANAQNLRPKLLIAVVDGRAQGRVSQQSVMESVAAALSVPVVAASSGEEPGELGVLSVVISNQGALLIWTLPDGRGETRNVAHGVTAAAIVTRIARVASDMSLEFATLSAIKEGDLVDPYLPLTRRRLPSPWAQSSASRQRRRLHLDLVDAFEEPARRTRRASVPNDTINPWRSR